MKICKSKLVLGILSLAMCLSCFGLFITTKTNVSATETTTFTMRYGASAYLNEISGVKFAANVTDETATNYGMLIVPYDYFAKAGITIADTTDYVNEFKTAYEQGKIDYPAVIKEGLPVYNDLQGAYISHAIVEINDFNYDRRWFGIAFQNNDGTYEYAEFNDNIRSISYIASASLNKLKYAPEELSEEEKFTINKNKNLLENFVTTALDNVNKTANESLLSVQIPSNTVAIGEEISITTTLPNGVYMSVYYESSDEELLSVSQDGVIKGLKLGSAKVFVKTCLDDVVKSVDVDVTLNGSLNNTLANYDSKDDSVVAEVLTDSQYCHENSASVIKYTFTNDGIDRGYYNKSKSGNVLLDESSILFNTYKNDIIDWSTAYVGFWIKNTSVYDFEVGLRFQTATGEGENKQWQGTVLKYEWYQAKVYVSQNSSWNYVEMSLADIARNADNMYGGTKGSFYTENVTDFKFCIAIHVSGLAVDNSATFYIDGVSVYNKLPSDPNDEILVSGTKNSEIRTYEINRDSDYIKEGDTSAKFTYYHDGWNGEWYRLTQADAETFNITDWDNVYISFYVYSFEVLNINFRYGSQEMLQSQTTTANEWTKITCSLKDIGITSIDALNTNAFKCRVLAGTQNKEYTFYVDDFILINREFDSLDSAIVAQSGDPNSVAVTTFDYSYGDESNSSIMYTFTNNGTTYDNQQDGSYTSRIILDDESVLFNNCSVTDWSTAYVRFYIKNTSGYDVRLAPRFQTAIGEGENKQWKGTVLKYEWWQNKAFDVSKNSTDWTMIEVSLADIASSCDAMAGTTKGDFYKENVTDFKFCLAVCIKSPQDTSVSFYIDGLEVYNKV